MDKFVPSNSWVVKSKLLKKVCRHNTFCLFFNFVHGYRSLTSPYVIQAFWK